MGTVVSDMRHSFIAGGRAYARKAIRKSVTVEVMRKYEKEMMKASICKRLLLRMKIHMEVNALVRVRMKAEAPKDALY
jgi:hypothetical protein